MHGKAITTTLSSREDHKHREKARRSSERRHGEAAREGMTKQQEET
jgi:hypothetical protein